MLFIRVAHVLSKTASIIAMPRSYCTHCGRPDRVCICHALPKQLISTSTPVIVVQTAAEAKCKVGTAWLLPLVLATSKVIPARGHSDAIQITREAALLYPGEDSRKFEELESTPKALVLLDGTWKSTRRLLSSSTTLRTLPRVHLPPSTDAALFRVRRPPAHVSAARSTAEAVADALEELDRATDAALSIRRAVSAFSESQIGFVRERGVKNVPHRTERAGYVPELYAPLEGDGQ